VDLPADARITEMYVPPDATLSSRYVPDLLGGLGIVEGELCRIIDSQESGKLYGTFKGENRERVHARLIPYHVWNNRGPTEMTVWLPICY
jgi:DUF1680 family protein